MSTDIDRAFEDTDEKPTETLIAKELLENFKKTGGSWDEIAYAVG